MNLEGMISRINSWKWCLQICNIVTFDQRQVTHPDLKIWRLSLEETSLALESAFQQRLFNDSDPSILPTSCSSLQGGEYIGRHAAFPGYEANYPAPLFKRAPEAKRIQHLRYRCGRVYQHLHHLRQPHEISFVEFASPLPARKILHSTILTGKRETTATTDWLV